MPSVMRSIENHESDLCFLQASIKTIERVVCIFFKEHAIRRVINLVVQFLKRLDRKAGETY